MADEERSNEAESPPAESVIRPAALHPQDLTRIIARLHVGLEAVEAAAALLADAGLNPSDKLLGIQPCRDCETHHDRERYLQDEADRIVAEQWKVNDEQMEERAWPV